MTNEQCKEPIEDRRRSATDQFYDVGNLAKVHGFTIDRALRLIEEHGNGRMELDAAADKIKAEIGSH